MSAKTLQRNTRRTPHRKSSQLLPALVAVGSACSLAAVPAAALELGEVQVNSALGQPLRASIAYALAPNEQLTNYCIYLRPGAASSQMPVFSRAQISVTDGAILVTGDTPIREPMLSMQVAVDCPYTPHLLREYTLMIDPVAPAYAPPATSARPATSSAPQTTPASNTPVRATNPPVTAVRRTIDTNTPIGQGTNYQVQPGDTLSTIVSRIEGRTMKLWPSVNAIFAVNPDAFIDNDVNRLLAGKTLVIPDLVGTAPVAALASESTAMAATPEIAPSADASNIAIDLNAAPQSATAEIPTEVEATTTAENIVVDPDDGSLEVASPANDPVIDLEPREIIVEPTDIGATEIVIQDTIIEDETATRVTPVVNTDGTSGNGAWNWLIWLGGSGLALILGLLLFGRSIRERFGSTPDAAEAISGRRQNDDPTQETLVGTEIDYEFEDTINSRAISLDADLDAGTGLHQNLGSNATEDYGVAITADEDDTFDLEITAESAFTPDEVHTDVIEPHLRADPTSILDVEVLPETDGEYDLSMIVDATKQTLSDTDDTATDLKAIEIDADRPADEDDYTLSQEADYQVLEQDYEDELTATQALSAEVMRAAEELAARMKVTDDVQVTEEMEQIAEPTNKLRAIETTQELPTSDATAEMELPADVDPNNTAELATGMRTDLDAVNDEHIASATTIEMSAAGSDVTVEMQVESGKVDTKKKK